MTASGAGTFGPDPVGEVERLTELGVHRIAIPPLAFDAAGIGDAFARYHERVISKV